jgi:hypothetical protein
MQVDVDDCVAAFAAFKLDPDALLERYVETAKYDLNPQKMIENFIVFTEAVLKKNMVNHDFLERVVACK